MGAKIKPDYRASIDFLARWFDATGADWIPLARLKPDSRRFEVESFTRDRKHEIGRWLAKFGADSNIYFHLNPTTRPLTSKGSREDVGRLAFLHVDVDPRPDPEADPAEHLTAERERILAMSDGNLPDGVPPPTVVIDSGNGFQFLWLLREPLVIDGDLGAAEDAKRYNLALELAFGADSCHNLDRVLRLPGSINRPNSKKRRKGRVDALARLVSWDPTRVYDLDQFAMAPAVAPPEGRSRPVASVQARRLSSVDDLGHSVSDRVKATIVQGVDPLEPDRHASRSETLFWVCCEMKRAGVDDDVVLGVITDPDFAISESIRDKGRAADRYARRQVERANEELHNTRLPELNDRFFVVGNAGGKCRVVEEREDPVLRRSVVTFQTFADFKNRFNNQRVQVGEDKDGNPKKEPLGSWWINCPHRRQFESIVFAPERDVAPDVYNLWQGFAFDAEQGSLHEPFLAHLRDNVCRGDQPLLDYLTRWMALAVQRPGEQGHVAVVFRGKRGTGKSFVAKTLGRVFQRHYLAVTNPKHLVGAFNAHLRDVSLLFGDEAFYAGDKKHESVLKTLITEDTLIFERKGVDAETGPNTISLIMASNDDWAVPAGLDERRFFVLDVGDARAQDTAYFGAIQRDLDAGGYAHLLHHLRSIDLAEFDVRRVPETDALREQKRQSLRGDRASDVMLDILREGVTPGLDVHKSDPARFNLNLFAEATGLGTRSRAADWLRRRGLLDDEAGATQRKVHRVDGSDYESLDEVPEALRPMARRVNGPRMHRLASLPEIRAARPWCGLVDAWDGPEEWTLARDLPAFEDEDDLIDVDEILAPQPRTGGAD